jgi:hypothetical protein
MQYAPISQTRFVQEQRRMRFLKTHEGWLDIRLSQVSNIELAVG